MVGPRNKLAGVVYQTPEALQRYVAAGALTDETLVSAFADAAARFPERTALSQVDWTCSYAELDSRTDRAAAGLLRLGLRQYDRVLFQLHNTSELVIAVLACFKAGLIPICTLAAHRRQEIGYLGRHAQARAHIVPAHDPRFDFQAFAAEMRAEIPTLIATITTGGVAQPGAYALEALIDGEDATAARTQLAAIQHDPFQVAIFQLSGGTTDVPKIIPRFHNEYLYTMRTVLSHCGLDDKLVAYTPNPMMHNAPMACIWGPAVFFGGEVAIATTLEAEEVGPLMQQRKPNWMIVPPVVLGRLHQAGWASRLDFNWVRGFATTHGRPQYQRAVNGAPVWPLYGMTEGLLAYGNAADPDSALNETVGRSTSPLDDIRIVAPGTDSELPDGEIGELIVRGPCTIRGYYDAEDRNKVAFTSGGFYRSGDLMRYRVIDGRRYLVFEGRIKDVVSRGGEKINCEEVERVALGHPAIAAIAIVAMPDPTYGERACAFVIPAPGAGAIGVPELGAFLEAQGLAKFKWPERIEPIDEFPLTSSGKLSKPTLRTMIEARLRAQ